MDPSSLLNLILGNGGVLVLLIVLNVVQYRQNVALKTEKDECDEARLRDLKEGEMLAKAYLSIREQDKGGVS